MIFAKTLLFIGNILWLVNYLHTCELQAITSTRSKFFENPIYWVLEAHRKIFIK
jgi:hypothetical protein